MSGTLVITYSWTGKTEKVADRVAKALGAERQHIRETSARRGVCGYMSGIVSGLLRRGSPIRPVKANLSRFDLVILGTPVWAGHMSGPARQFLLEHGGEPKAFALIVTSGSGGPYPDVAKEAEALVGKPPLAVLNLRQADIDAGTIDDAVAPFLDEVGTRRAA